MGLLLWSYMFTSSFSKLFFVLIYKFDYTCNDCNEYDVCKDCEGTGNFTENVYGAKDVLFELFFEQLPLNIETNNSEENYFFKINSNEIGSFLHYNPISDKYIKSIGTELTCYNFPSSIEFFSPLSVSIYFETNCRNCKYEYRLLYEIS